MSNTVEKFTLENGVRVVCEPIENIQSVAVGIWCQNGSRLEQTNEAGISHLIEHMLFKGTQKRTAEQIAQEIEGRGGHLNAFTDREMTCYYARALAEDLPIVLDVLSDMYTHSKLDETDLELEKNVVQEEIKKYQDSPEENIHDLHTQSRWGEHPLARPIIGTKETVASFKQHNLKDYMRKRYVAGKTLVAVAGKVEPKELKKLSEQYLISLNSDFELPNEKPPQSNASENYYEKDVEQVHFCIGGDAVNIYDERRHALSVLDAILGGSMSSRLFQEIREKRGLVYAIGSYSAIYREAGAFTIFGGTAMQAWETVKQLIKQQLDTICNEKVSQDELERTKRMFKGNVVLGLENMGARMRRIARNELIFGRDIPIEETLEKVDAVSQDDILTLAQQFLSPEKMTITAIIPKQNN